MKRALIKQTVQLENKSPNYLLLQKAESIMQLKNVGIRLRLKEFLIFW